MQSNEMRSSQEGFHGEEPTDVPNTKADQISTDALTAFIQRDFSLAEQALTSLGSASSADGNKADQSKIDPCIKHNTLISKFYAENTQQNMDNFTSFILELLPEEMRPPSTDDFFMRLAEDRFAESHDDLKMIYNSAGPVALFNIAVIAYHMGYTTAAASIGDFLYTRIEATDDWLALRICFLLIDVQLRLGDVPSASTIASFAEKLLKSFSVAEKEGATPSSNLKILTPEWRGRWEGIIKVPTSFDDAKYCMHVYSARLSIDGENDTESARAARARKEAKNALVTDDTGTRPTAVALLVKARVEQNYAKSFRILGSIMTQSSPNMVKKVRPLVLNTLGVLHHRLGRHALAACYFEHSREAFDALFKSEPDALRSNLVYLNVLKAAKDTQVSYNLALQYMKLGDYGRALDLFGTCARNDRSLAKVSALLWLRMAECCIGIESNSNCRQNLSRQGRGRGRRIVMQPTKRVDKVLMQYGATCARAAVAILDRRRSETNDSEASKGKKPITAALAGTRHNKLEHTSSSDKPLPHQDIRIRAAALALIAYTSLAFDPGAVIEAADELLRTHAKSESDRSELVRLYSAEACCMLGRYNDAANRIAPLLPSDNTVDSSTREMAHVNMALMHVYKGDLEAGSRAAKLALKTFAAQQNRSKLLRRETIFATSYIFLRNDEVDIARRCLQMLLSVE